MRALIIGSGVDIKKEIINTLSYEYVICVDGGLDKAEKLEISPNVIIGDFDSVKKNTLEYYKKSGLLIEEFPPEKDYTDMDLAVEYAVNKGFSEIVLLGASGTRLDHTLANIMLIEKFYKKNIKIKLIDNNNIVQTISDNDKLCIEKKEGCFLSIIPLSDEITGITLKGFKFPLNDVTVKRGETRCISNEVEDTYGEIEIKTGSCVVIISKD